eukprot:Blabericola_migrator_1__3897@NODE_2179_length_3163_cov_43_647933_g1373_i0_p1_GENE_NODE_2179_length_3163_cov_43_647933_g1373_i0NODE_2179_length_3163_cov_43_647933_g1373_i0_p1_ORF_typecomplete_len317_score39_89_NODE_2179_length_3163_cov_43_647933_g1373_i07141664
METTSAVSLVRRESGKRRTGLNFFQKRKQNVKDGDDAQQSVQSMSASTPSANSIFYIDPPLAAQGVADFVNKVQQQTTSEGVKSTRNSTELAKPFTSDDVFRPEPSLNFSKSPYDDFQEIIKSQSEIRKLRYNTVLNVASFGYTPTRCQRGRLVRTPTQITQCLWAILAGAPDLRPYYAGMCKHVSKREGLYAEEIDMLCLILLYGEAKLLLTHKGLVAKLVRHLHKIQDQYIESVSPDQARDDYLPLQPLRPFDNGCKIDDTFKDCLLQCLFGRKVPPTRRSIDYSEQLRPQREGQYSPKQRGSRRRKSVRKSQK